jgi:hypothetical protein
MTPTTPRALPLLVGVLAVLAGALFLLDDLSTTVDLDLELLWPVSAAVLALGTIAAAALRWRRDATEQRDPAQGPVETTAR